MGQSSSADNNLNVDVVYVQNKLAGQLKVLSRLAFLRHIELVEIIEELNTVTKDFVDRHGKRLCFSIRRGTDTTILWKSTIRIRCLRLNTRNKIVESARLLTLRQFIVLYKEIKDQIAMLTVAHDSMPSNTQKPSVSDEQEASTSAQQEPDIAKEEASISENDKFSTSQFFSPDDLCDDMTECCVCMDRKACIMLSCSHEFCEPCIDSWTRDSHHSTCPLCRSRVEGSDDAWVLTDKNDKVNYEHEVTGYLVGLADRGNSE